MGEKIVIVGNGVAGITAARFIRKKSDFPIIVISAETEYFFSRTALMYVFMGHMKFEHTKPYEDSFWKKNNIDLVFGYVSAANFFSRELTLAGGQKIQYDKLILATGSKSGLLGCPGENLTGVQTLYSYADLQKLEKIVKTRKNALIAGGGLVGIELAEMLHSRNISVNFLIREKSFYRDVLPEKESALVSSHLIKHGIHLTFNSEIKSINGNLNGEVESVTTKTGEVLNCDLVCISIGVKPNVGFLQNSELEINRGILVNAKLETNLPNVYAIGDCAELRNPEANRRSIEPVWYTGKIMGEVVAGIICGENREYHPGNWFNSAKFFDIEYQTYGYVPNEKTPGIEWFYWEDSTQNKTMRLVWSKQTNSLLGMQTLGIRILHSVADQWITSQIKIQKVVDNLDKANFDPEFFPRFEKNIQKKFYQQFPELNSVKELS